jgi:hypothetical protein
MLWSLTKWNHRLSTTRLVRWWLRMTALDRFILVVIVNFLFLVYSFFTFVLWLANYAGRSISGALSSDSFFGSALKESVPTGLKFVLGLLNFIASIAVFFEFVFLIFAFGLAVFFIIDLVWDTLNTRRDLSNIALRDDVILATRGEYMGGHPSLPHARFVYLILSGTQSDPYIGIFLPGFQPVEYKIPLIDITGKKTGVDESYGRPASLMNISLTSITPSVWKGSRTALDIEYSYSGRKYTVELGSFLRGNDEVQQWKNYLTCAQAEADTGQKPYGDWKSLPKSKPKKKGAKQ